MNYKPLFATAFAASALLAAAAFAEEEENPVSDGGEEVVAEAQESEQAPVSPKFKNASKILKDAMKKKNWKERWDPDKKRILVVADADFDCADPATDKNFLPLREMAAKRAVLLAKGQIAEYVNSEISAGEMLDIPGTDVHKELGAEAARVNAAIEKQAAELATLLAQTDEVEAASLRSATVGQRLDDLFAAAIKKLDSEYDKDAHQKEAQARLAELKAKYDEASKEFQALLARAETLKKEVKSRQESSVTVQAKLPLFGATVIMQTESWNKATGKYQVAVLVCWSKALEEASRAIVTGGSIKANPGNLSVNDWLDNQDLATMVGPRQFIDEKGERWFLGVTARPYDDEMNSSARMKYKSLAQTFAQQMAVFSVFADVETQKTAAQALETRVDGDDDYAKEDYAVAESFAQKITQKLEKQTVRGLQKLAEEETEHPITGKGIIVCVYGINAESATAALEIEKKNIATLIDANRYQTFERGRKAAAAAAVKASKDRPEDFKAGVEDQTGRLQSEMDERHPENKRGGQRNIYSSSSAAPAKKAPGKSTSGSFLGDADVSDDF